MFECFGVCGITILIIYSESLNLWNGEIVSYGRLAEDGGRWRDFVKKAMQLQVT